MDIHNAFFKKFRPALSWVLVFGVVVFFGVLFYNRSSNTAIQSLQSQAGRSKFVDSAMPVNDGDPTKSTYIIQLKNDLPANRVSDSSNELANRYGGEPKMTFTSAIKGYTAVMSRSQAMSLSNDSSVLLVAEDSVVSVDEIQTNAPWGLDRIDQASLPLNGRYEYNGTGTGVDVYIVDTGIRITHEQFGGRASADFDSVGDGQPAGQDCHGHGTHVAGIVGGSTYGAAKGVRLHSVRVLACNGSGYASSTIAGLDWVVAHRIGPAVINMSLSGGYDALFNNAVANVVNSGIDVVVAAGNSSADACSYSPASAPEAITVGASNRTDNLAGFSNRGSCVDLNAPGEEILSAYRFSDISTTTFSGTSMASPFVAGVVAVLKQNNPNLSPSEISNILKSSASHMPSVPSNTTNKLLYSTPSGGTPSGGCYEELATMTINPSTVSMIPNQDQSLDISVTIRNNDPAGCPSSDFALNPPQANNGFTWSPSGGQQVNLSPGQEVTRALTITHGPNLVPGEYNQVISVNHGQLVTTNYLRISVPCIPAPEPTLILGPATNPTPPSAGQPVTYTYTLKNNAIPTFGCRKTYTVMPWTITNTSTGASEQWDPINSGWSSSLNSLEYLDPGETTPVRTFTITAPQSAASANGSPITYRITIRVGPTVTQTSATLDHLVPGNTSVSGPVVTITTPQNNSTMPLTGTMTFTAQAEVDNGLIGSIVLSIGAKTLKTCTPMTWNFATCSVTVTTDSYKVGSHTLTATATEFPTNQTASQTITVTKSGSGPKRPTR